MPDTNEVENGEADGSAQEGEPLEGDLYIPLEKEFKAVKMEDGPKGVIVTCSCGQHILLNELVRQLKDEQEVRQ